METLKKMSLTWRILLPCVVLFIIFGVVFFLFDNMKSTRMTTKELVAIHALGFAYLDDKYPGDWNLRDEKLYKGIHSLRGKRRSLTRSRVKLAERQRSSVVIPGWQLALRWKAIGLSGRRSLRKSKRLFSRAEVTSLVMRRLSARFTEPSIPRSRLRTVRLSACGLSEWISKMPEWTASS